MTEGTEVQVDELEIAQRELLSVTAALDTARRTLELERAEHLVATLRAEADPKAVPQRDRLRAKVIEREQRIAELEGAVKLGSQRVADLEAAAEAERRSRDHAAALAEARALLGDAIQAASEVPAELVAAVQKARSAVGKCHDALTLLRPQLRATARRPGDWTEGLSQPSERLVTDQLQRLLVDAFYGRNDAGGALAGPMVYFANQLMGRLGRERFTVAEPPRPAAPTPEEVAERDRVWRETTPPKVVAVSDIARIDSRLREIDGQLKHQPGDEEAIAALRVEEARLRQERNRVQAILLQDGGKR